jgi:hypothetical protein
MDISYTLYYVLMDELRSIVKERYAKRMKGAWSYISTDLIHIEDVENSTWNPIRPGVVGEITFISETYTIFLGSQPYENKARILENGTYIMRYPSELIEHSLNEWLSIVKARYLLKK